ncbi:MAG: cation diffusion facilitator family transporter [Frankiales bacterium]|nr:cation diffusion facilitator family transporter [Frankiales bacterium]
MDTAGRTGAHGHAVGGSHAGHGHGHGVSATADRRYLGVALALVVGFMAVEVVVGALARSLALLADAGHMLTDAGAIALALVAVRLAARPAKGAFTYGLKRVEVLSAQANGLTLLVLAVVFTVEGVLRLVDPPDVRGGLVLGTALSGVVVNLAAAYALSKADRRSLAVEGGYQHVVTDLYAFLATAVAAGVVVVTGWDRADPVATLVVAALMLRSGTGLVRESGRVFLEASPRGTDPDEVASAILATPGVVGVHELHVWEVTSGFPALSAHVLVDAASDCHRSRQDLEAVLAASFGIRHTTLQVDHRDEHGHDEPLLGATTVRAHPGHAGALGSTGDHDHDAGC